MNSKFQSSADDMPLDEDYRPINVMAIIAMVFAAVSAVSMLVPAMLLFALLGLVFGTLALIRISRDERNTAGRGVAMTAICCSLFFLAATLSYQLAIQDYHQRVAVFHAQQWLNLVREDDRVTAYTLTRPPKLRGVTKRGSGQVVPEAEMSSFTGQPVIRALKGVTQEIRFIQLKSKSSHQGSTYFVLEFALPEQLGSRRFTINMRRKYDDKSKTADWTVAKFEFTR